MWLPDTVKWNVSTSERSAQFHEAIFPKWPTPDVTSDITNPRCYKIGKKILQSTRYANRF